MTVDASDLTVDDLDAVYAKRQTEDTTQLNRLKTLAVNMTNQVYGGAVRASAELEGDPEDFALLVWAHYVKLREGGDVTSASQSGGSVAYATAQAGDGGLSETSFGRQALVMLGDNASIGIEKASSSWR